MINRPHTPCLKIGLMLAAGIILGTGCNTVTPERSSLFNPRKADKQGPAFAKVTLDRQLDPALLEAPQQPYRVGVGDVLDIELAGFPDSRTQTFVLPDGTIYFDLAEAVQVGNYTLAEIKQALENELSKRYAEPEIHINLIVSKSQRVMILGQIVNPGTYSITRPTTVLESLANAGGFSSPTFGQSKDLADLYNAVLIRGGAVLPIDFEALVKDGDMSQNIYLQPNDYIFIPSANQQSIQVLGSVGSPQSFEYTGSTTMISAIARANGALPTAYLSNTILVRGSLKKPQVAVVNVKRILSGHDTNFLLRPGDIIWVPDRPWEPLERYVYRIIESAARTVAVNEGARWVDEDAQTTISISAGGSQ